MAILLPMHEMNANKLSRLIQHGGKIIVFAGKQYVRIDEVSYQDAQEELFQPDSE